MKQNTRERYKRTWGKTKGWKKFQQDNGPEPNAKKVRSGKNKS